MNLEDFVRILSTAYASHDNDERRAATIKVMQMEDQMNPETLLRTGLDLFGIVDRGAAVQAYGAVLLRRAVSSGRLSADSVPYNEIMTWYFTEPTLGRLLCGDLVDLITECLIYKWPEEFPDLIDRICPPQAQLSQQPRKIRLICSLVVKCMEPHLGNVPVHRMKSIKGAMTINATKILLEIIQALFDMYTAAGGEGSKYFAEGTGESIADCLTIIVDLAPCLTMSQWWEIGIGNAMSVLTHWHPIAQEALAATAALLRSDIVRTSSIVDPKLSELVNVVLTPVDVFVAERNYGILEEILELLLDLPESVIQTIADSVGQACLSILVIPSVYLASSVCVILRRLGNVALTQINPLELMIRISALVEKNKFHPLDGTNNEGKLLSEQQYGSPELFDRGFAEFRSTVGRILNLVAQIYPVVCNQFILQLLTNLCDGCGTPTDPRTPAGFVKQQSSTFRTWEVTEFLINHLSESFKYSSEHVPQAITALVTKKTEDMVLYPVFLNMLSSFWNCRDDAALGVWDGTLGIIFSCLENKNFDQNDIDTIAARKRAVTLLVNACSQHTSRIIPFCDLFMRRMERLLIAPSTTSKERAILYEAAAALTSALPSEEGQLRLQSFFNPIVKILMKRVQEMNQKEFNNIITGRTPDFCDERNILTCNVAVIAGVLRRCQPSPYIVESTTALAPSILKLMEFIHGIRAEELPRAFVGILDIDRDDREQYLPGKSRKSVPISGPVKKAKHNLVEFRMSLYQVIGALSTFLPAETLQEMLRTLMSSLELLSMNSIRSLTVHCLFPVGISHPLLLPIILPAFTVIFLRRSKSGPAQIEDDVIDSKQLFYFSKDIFTFMRQNIIEKNMLDNNIELLRFIVEVGLTILESGANVHEAARFVITIIDGNSNINNNGGNRNNNNNNNNNNNTGSMLISDGVGDNTTNMQLEELLIFAFGRMLDFAIRADDSLLPFKDRERHFFFLADAYINRFPRFTPAIQLRFPQERVDELHTHLVMAQRFDVKRRRFKDFLLQASAPTPNVN